jgi:predicted RNA-binding protein YlqC (UPF0109 family)
MLELLQYLIRSIISSDDFHIEKTETEFDLQFSIHVPQEAIGLVIGKKGCVVNALRKVIALKLPQGMSKRIYLKIADA